MAISAVSLTGGGSSTATTSPTFTAQSAGVWLVLIVSADDYRTTSGSNRPESTGWTLQSTGQDFLGAYVWTLVATGSETTVSYTIGSAASSAYMVVAVSGATSTLDNTPSATHGHGGGSTATTSVTPSAGTRYVLAVANAMHSSVSFTGVSSWTNSYTAVAFQAGPASGGREAIGVAGLITSAASATSSTATWSGTSQLCSYGASVVFRESGGGAPPRPPTVIGAYTTPVAQASARIASYW